MFERPPKARTSCSANWSPVAASFAYHQDSSCTPNAAPWTASGLVAAATLPRKLSDQCAQVANARSDGRLRNFSAGVICGATVSLNSDPPGRSALLGVVPAGLGRERRRTVPAGAPAGRRATPSGSGCSMRRRSRVPDRSRRLQRHGPRCSTQQVVDDAELPEIVESDVLAGHERPAHRRRQDRSEVDGGAGAVLQRDLVSAARERPLDDGCARRADAVVDDDRRPAGRDLVAVEVRQVERDGHPGAGRHRGRTTATSNVFLLNRNSSVGGTRPV